MGKKTLNLPDFEETNSKSSGFYHKFQQALKKQKDSNFFQLVCSQIWLTYFLDAALYLYAFQYLVFLGVQYSWRILPTDTIFHTTGCPLFLCKHMTTLCLQRAVVVDCQGHGPLIIGVWEKMILQQSCLGDPRPHKEGPL